MVCTIIKFQYMYKNIHLAGSVCSVHATILSCQEGHPREGGREAGTRPPAGPRVCTTATVALPQRAVRTAAAVPPLQNV